MLCVQLGIREWHFSHSCCPSEGCSGNKGWLKFFCFFIVLIVALFFLFVILCMAYQYR